MLTDEERDWKNSKDLTDGQKEFLYGMEYVQKDIIQNALWFWRDNNYTGWETFDKIVGELTDNLVKSMDEYIDAETDDMIVSMLESNVG